MRANYIFFRYFAEPAFENQVAHPILEENTANLDDNEPRALNIRPRRAMKSTANQFTHDQPNDRTIITQATHCVHSIQSVHTFFP